MTWQPEAVVYPDIELALTGRFRDALDARTEPYTSGVYVSNSVPNPRRDRMVIVRRDGGVEGEMRDRARLGIRVWGPTEQDATDLASLAVALLKSFPDGDPILRVVIFSGPTPVVDQSAQPLRYFTAEVHTRGVPL